MKKVTDMTQGRPLPLLVRFALPLMLGSLCQLLYTAAGFLSWLAVDIILGLTQGFGILFAQLFGKKQWPRLRQAVGSSIVLAVGTGGALTALELLSIDPALALAATPLDIRPGAAAYLRVLFCGIIVTVCNRLACTLLQSLGNSRDPVFGNIASCVLNIGLDVLFVGVFRWGVAGAALATVAAQLGCLLYCLAGLRRIPQLRPVDFTLSAALLGRLLALGGPLAFRNGVISLGGLFVQSAINGYGKLFVAGMTAVERYFGLINLPGDGLEGAFANFCAQNYGAGRLDRIKAGLRCSVRLALAGWAVVAAVMLVFGRGLLGLLLAGSYRRVYRRELRLTGNRRSPGLL